MSWCIVPESLLAGNKVIGPFPGWPEARAEALRRGGGFGVMEFEALGTVRAARALAPLSSPAANTVGQFHGPAKGAPETERLAALQQYPKTGTKRQRVLDFIAARGEEGATDDEVAAGTGIYLYTAAPRRVELVTGGWVEDSGRRRPTPRSPHAAVWVLTERGRRELAQAAA